MATDARPPSARQKGARRAQSTRAARSDRFAYVSLVMDRHTNNITMDAPWLSLAEAEGILANAFVLLQGGRANATLDIPVLGTSVQDMDDEDD